jgi:hypothetical protein
MPSSNHGRAAPWALIIGALIPALVIAMHPTGHDAAGDPGGAVTTVNVLVHSVMIAAQPLVLFGLLGLSRRLGWSDLAVAAPVFFAVAILTGIWAAIMSGFVAPTMIDGAHNGDVISQGLLEFTGSLNQGFAKVFLAMEAVGILLWSLAILRQRGLPDWLGYLGAVATVVLAAIPGRGAIGVTEMMVATYLPAIWMIGVGVVLLRRSPPT